METRELIKAPQLILVYAITVLYTITFTLAAVVTTSTGHAIGSPQDMHQIAKMEPNNLNYPQVIRNGSSG
ncbi:hypothetical protein [Nitrosomonas supralitoralis]|uniref:Uncharacterized protein n=1 Tax=Nitrosomonas supralitoralis TaxID=2116706 RepID=A0A2P7NU18_9PROT|nr:hypothetical protein [Nitrosomonas supralitoralis]PSJ16964.1 hypothetical protein C7H79_10715 [Nitrosomonas supralitoralis]